MKHAYCIALLVIALAGCTGHAIGEPECGNLLLDEHEVCDGTHLPQGIAQACPSDRPTLSLATCSNTCLGANVVCCLEHEDGTMDDCADYYYGR
jgi:hypothetical protein